MDDVDKVKQKIDIVDLIGSYIPLKKAGRNFKCPCPFHNEKSPSFVVSPDRQIWHCFGCQKGGDVFTFVQEYENTTFGDALKFLAQKAGVKLTTSAARTEIERKRDIIYGINLMAAQYYEYVLFSHHAGKQALEYVLEQRKQPEKLLKTFQVGYAPGSGTALVQFLLKKNYDPKDIVDAGLATPSGGRIVDFFRNRLMFPISDPRGNIIAFSGRALTPEQMPKYVNTRETAVYRKGETVYGLNLARDEIKKQGTVIVMEGEFDVISAHKEGIGNVVAVKGTALTPEQIELLKRYTPKIVFCFDTDPAGTAAQRRSIQLIENAGVLASVIVLPQGKDPDELLSNDPVAFKQAMKKDVHIYDFIIESAVKQHGSGSMEDKKEIMAKTLPFLAAIDNEVIKEHYLKKLATALNTSFDAVEKQLDKEKSQKAAQQLTTVSQKKKDREEVLSLYLMALLLQSKKLLEHLRQVDVILNSISFSNPAQDKLFNVLKKRAEEGIVSVEEIAKTLPAELLPTFDTAFLLPMPELPEDKYESELKKVAYEERNLIIKKRLSQIKLEMDHKMDSTEEEKLQEEANKLSQELSE